VKHETNSDEASQSVERDGRALRLSRPAILLGFRESDRKLQNSIRFEQACEVFFDPFVNLLDAAPENEAREAVLGLTEDWTLLFVVHVVRERGVIRIISARGASRAERRVYEDNG
jgi:uncharacterized DUF497 family protein